MRHFVRPNTDDVQPPEDAPSVKDLGEISVTKLLESSLLAVQREVRNLTIATAKGKLSPTDARDLRDYTKLLFELEERENAILNSAPDAALIEAARKIIQEADEGNK